MLPYSYMDRVAISVEDVSKVHKLARFRIHALKDVSFTVEKGSFTAIAGYSGKSTILSMLGTLDKPTGGAVRLNGADITRMRDGKLAKLRRNQIGFVFQSFYLQPFLRLVENIEIAGMFGRMRRKDRRKRAMQLLEEVGLGDRAQHFPHQLSGGQVQRAAIARAMLNDPEIILADEPTGNLDPDTARTILDVLDNLRRERGTTLVIATHDPNVQARADQIIRLDQGEVIA